MDTWNLVSVMHHLRVHEDRVIKRATAAGPQAQRCDIFAGGV